MEEKRLSRPNRVLAGTIDDTLALMPSNISRYQAALVMKREGAPQEVIGRVLNEPEKRRRPYRRKG